MMVMFFAFLVNPISEIVGIGTQLGEVFAGMARANEVLCTPRETDNPARRHAMGTIRGDIAFENVQFSYDGKRPAVQGVSFVAPAGTVTALVGPSGAGKSTITLLLAAFHEPQGGRITVDGLNLTTIRLDTYRSQLGIVLQDDFLFAGSIAENVAYARPSASQEAILDACRAAHIDEFAERFEHKYDTHVGELGGLLSRGQRQRIAIARALLANPRILILDEPTSTLDAESERYVQESLRKLMAGRTTFVIAHRLATIRHADRILFIENGHVVESGTHESLIKLGRRYSQLHRQQLVIEREFLTTLPDEPQREEVPEKRQTS
jgi:subfamily B ATP-binding cassette protein MsbA